ncbi:MAG: SusC/RagA family TonB-linked outer membrane protein [Chitinophagaceae bacterium]|nr:SusC/RagA family TonB-linked outer membrane protein [Chitinophagaceae bacterium]
MKKAILLSGILILLCFLQASAQQRVITGTVTSNTGTPLAGASVVVEGSKIGVTTNTDGTFSINVPGNAKALQISFVGYSTQTVSITGKTSVTIVLVLAGAGETLENVVVSIGYGTAQKKDLTGAVSSITVKNFNQGVINSPDQLLQNKVPGLEVTSTSGQPGVAQTVQIRGTSSIRAGNNPLYVVDGVPLDGGTARPNIGNTFGSTPSSDPLIFIDPNSIQQVDVQKDASGTAIYGSRGANGVIFITTKKGARGPMRVDVGASVGVFAGYMRKFDVLTTGEYKTALAKYSLPSTLDGGVSTDALSAITENKLSQNYSLALSGGNDNGSFRTSFLGSKNMGFLKKSRLDKYIGTFNGQYSFIDKKLNIEFSAIVGNFGEQLSPVANSSGSGGNIISAALWWNPTFPLMTNGAYNFPSSGSNNPLGMIEAYDDQTSVNAFLGHISASYSILPNLQYKFLYGINHETGSRDQNIEGWIPGFPQISGVGNAQVANALLNSETFDHTLNYNGNINSKLSINALVGYEYFKTDFSNNSIYAQGFNFNTDYNNRVPYKYTDFMGDAQVQNPFNSNKNPSSELQSFFGRATLNYESKYYLTGTFRADGSNKFGTNNKYGYFPSVAAKWQISNEDFMKDIEFVNSLGLRASWGITGNQEFPAGSGVEQVAMGPFNVVGQINVKNPDLKWERTKQIDIGLDFAFAKGRIFGSLDYYSKRTSDILFSTVAIQPAPSATAWVNLPNAILANKGFEVALGATILQKDNFSWDVTGNLAYNKNDISKFNNSETGLPLQIITGQITGQGVSGALSQVIENGFPVNEWYLKPFKGFDQDGNQIIGDNPEPAGNPNPKIMAGFGTVLRFDKLTLNLNFGGSFNYLIYNNTATSVTNISGIANGRNIDRKAYESAEKPSSPVGASTRFLESGNYWKLRNATIRYDIGSAGQYFKNISVYVSGTNLFVLTKFSGGDPEVNIDKSNNGYPSRSISYLPYPTPRAITFGVNFSL